jgi:hypothetical protein
MMPRSVIFALLLFCLPVLRAAGPAAASETSSFDKTHERIDALLHGRDSLPILPAELRNPFSRSSERLPGGGDASAMADPSKQAALTDQELLERLAPAVQVRGIVESGGHPTIIIGRKPFEEGDTLSLLYGVITIEVKIKRITSDTFTLGYKDAELTLRLPR